MRIAIIVPIIATCILTSSLANAQLVVEHNRVKAKIFTSPGQLASQHEPYISPAERARKRTQELQNKIAQPTPRMPDAPRVSESSRNTSDFLDMINEENERLAAEDRRKAGREEEQALLEAQRETAKLKRQKLKQALFSAIYADNATEVDQLITQGADLKSTHKGYTPMHYAIALKKLGAIKTLISRGANFGTPENYYYSLMHWAAYNNHYDIIQLMLDNGAQPNLRDEQGYTPLDYAIGQKHHDIISTLGALAGK